MVTKYISNPDRKAVKEKILQVKNTISAIKKYKSLVIIDLRKLPDALFQAIRKQVRQNNGAVFVLKKPVVSRVLASDPRLSKYQKEATKPLALICTDKSPFEMNKFFKEFRRKKAAKVGDEPKEDLVVPEGDTDLPPGPALSELKAAGVNAQIKAGKISVVKASTVAKAGEKLTSQKVKALQTLNIMPFEVMAQFVMGYDGKYVYTRQVLDDAENVPMDLAHASRQANNVALNVGYPTSQNIDMLLGSAFKQAINVSVNGSLYSSSSLEQLLISALRQSMALENVEKK